ncbi:MAG: hypothetical protein DI582_01120 [Azospirillum brasilense]|nr:MAG: hypothetical protein DI582_01120 [Azospirillum brasilense]
MAGFSGTPQGAVGAAPATSITIQPAARTAQPPVLNLPTRQVAQAQDEAAQASAPGGEIVSTSREINWGSVVKGAAIVAGVVLVGVVGFAFLSGAVTGLVGGIAADSLVGATITGTANILGPLGTAIGNAASYTFNFAGGALGEFGSMLFGSSAATGAAAASTATVSAEHAGAIGSAVGAAGAGAAVAVAAPIAAKSIAALPMTETIAHHSPITQTVPVTGLEDGSLASALTAKKKVAMFQTGFVGGDHAHADSVPDMAEIPEIPEEQVASHSTANAKAVASKIIHHAGHSAEAAHHGAEAPDTADMPDGVENTEKRRSSAAVNRAGDNTRAWVERTRSDKQAPRAGFAATIRPDPAAQTQPAITPRTTEFATQLEAERAALDAALAQPAR